MIAVDTNILIYSHRVEAPFHASAQRVMKGLAEGDDRWAIPWPCIHEFLANVTHPRIYRTPTPLGSALDQAQTWLESPAVQVLSEEDGYWDLLRGTVSAAQVVGPQVHDARIAALCASHGVTELWTADRDFQRFKGLATKNPLVTGEE